MAEQDEGTSEMEHASEVLQRALIASDQPAEIVELRKQPLDLLAAAITT